MKNDFDLNLLQVAVVLYEEKSVSEAARKLEMSQPAMSRALAKLRLAFKDDLFLRSGYQMVPSPKGRALAISARELLGHAKPDILANTDFEPSTSNTTFCLALNEMGELWMFPELLRVLKAEAPHVHVRIVCPKREQLLVRMEIGDIDLAFGFPELNRAEFIRQKLGKASVVCLIRSDHPFTGDSLTVQQYLKFDHVEIGEEDRVGPFWARLIGSRKLIRKVIASPNHYSSIPGILKSCDAIATVSSVAAAYFCRVDPKLRMVKAPIPTVIPGYQYWHSRYHSDPRNQFIRHSFKKAFLSADVMAISDAIDQSGDIRPQPSADPSVAKGRNTLKRAHQKGS